MALLWALYFSIVNVGQTWYSFGEWGGRRKGRRVGREGKRGNERWGRGGGEGQSLFVVAWLRFRKDQ